MLWLRTLVKRLKPIEVKAIRIECTVYCPRADFRKVDVKTNC